MEQLNNRGHQVSICAPHGSIVPIGVKLLPTVKLPEEQDNDWLAVNKFIEKQQIDFEIYDIIHDFSHGHQFARRLNYNQELPIISMLWDPVIHEYGKAPYNIVCLSEWQKQRFEKLYSQKAIVMPPLVNTDRYKPDPKARRERFLFLGKISQEKGVHKAIEYALELKIPLDVVGGLIPSECNSEYLKHISNMIDRARLDGADIQFYWNVSEEDKIKFLQNAKAVIYPVQQDEAHWLVGVEAWACLTPTLSFARGAMEEISKGVPHYTVILEKHFKDSMLFLNSKYNESQLSGMYWVHNSQNIVIPLYEKLYQRVASGERW